MATEIRDARARPTLTHEQLLDHLRRRLPQFTPTAPPERLGAGYRSDISRVPGRPEPVIVKVATAPADRQALDIEARSLSAFEPDGPLANVGRDTVRPPHLLDVDQTQHILVIEDVGQVPHLGTWIAEGGVEREMGHLLGHFIAGLHWESFADPQLAVDVDNSAIQNPRIQRHYGAAADMLRKAGLPDADELGRRAAALGEQLQMPGVCVIQGNLWPPSILIADDGLRITGWELTHYGHPAQDVAHLAAHLWMHAHRASTPEAAERARATLRGFLSTYRAGLGSAFDEVVGPDGVRQSTIHVGVEILMRTTGAFQAGYLYDGLTVDAPALQEAVHLAARHIRSPESVDTFAPLLS